MSWFVVDDQYFQNRKAEALTQRALDGDADAGLAGHIWTVMGSRLKAARKDGLVETFDLYRVIPDPTRAQAVARILVEVGLWHDHDHYCDRCPRPQRGQWVYHDWPRYYKRTGAQERLAEALQAERKDPRLKAAVWERDRLPKTDPQAPDTALCVYCQRVLSKDTTKGPLTPEIEHIYAHPMGVDGLAISCRACNREKGARSAEEAGLNFHPTPAHAAALAQREDHRSHAETLEDLATPAPSDAPALAEREDHRSHAESLEDLVAPAPNDAPAPEPPVEWRADEELRSVPQYRADRIGHGSLAPRGLTDDLLKDVTGTPRPTVGEVGAPIAPAESQGPPGRREPAPTFPGRSLPNSGSAPSQSAPAQEPATAPVGASVPADVAEAVTGDLFAQDPLTATLEACFGSPLPPELGVAALVAVTGHCLTAEQQRLLDAALAYAHACTGACAPAHGRVRAHALPGARAVAGQGRGRQGTAGQGSGRARQGRRRRRGRRRTDSQPTCPTHGDRLPCRLCQEEDLS